MSGFNNKKTITIIAAILILTIAGGLYWYQTKPVEREQLIVSTTTSLYETGVLDVLKTRFETHYPEYNVSFISQGTGLAIETAKNGDADMILVHSPSQELGFMESGYGINRKIFAYNFFIIVGPESDPAGINGMDPLDALTTIAEKGVTGEALWVSRGDNSGTHSKEKRLWSATGLDLETLKAETIEGTSDPWYIEAGAGMTATLQLANQKDAYTLTDVATYLKNYANDNIELVKVVDSGEDTLNVYSAIVCNPEENPRGMYDGAMLFVRFLVSDEVQTMLVTYGQDEFGSTLFKPWIPELDNPDSDIVQWVEDFAYIDGTECPTQYRYQAGDLYQ
ncbi:MAG: substrate-binding domain-containing protein [Candidatus Bathyarchaeota archaeon]|nr:substrate-binding domain-containing protein [Candidatus Bathyarchaeota archaeon]